VSYYVIEFLELQVGEQDHLMAARNMMKWKCEDKAIMVARAAKQIGSKAFVKNFKFCYDKADDTVYCLVHLDDLAADHRRFTYNVGEETGCETQPIGPVGPDQIRDTVVMRY